jgi:hypothetical protein
LTFSGENAGWRAAPPKKKERKEHPFSFCNFIMSIIKNAISEAIGDLAIHLNQLGCELA